MTWQEYEADLERRLIDLHGRIHRGARHICWHWWQAHARLDASLININRTSLWSKRHDLVQSYLGGKNDCCLTTAAR
jgi:hypothetical protein